MSVMYILMSNEGHALRHYGEIFFHQRAASNRERALKGTYNASTQRGKSNGSFDNSFGESHDYLGKLFVQNLFMLYVMNK